MHLKSEEQLRYQAQQQWQKKRSLRDKHLRQWEKETNPQSKMRLYNKVKKEHSQMVAIQRRYTDFPMGDDEITGSVPVKVRPPTASLPPESPPARLFKYIRRKHADSMIANGELLIRPASEFKNAVNAARQDDELTAKNLKLELEPAHHPLFTITSNSGLPYEMTVKDYYIWSSAKSLKCQLFTDFESDSCVEIFDVPQFLSRLKSEFESRKLTFACHSVVYHDAKINSFEGPYFYKVASEYANQDEYRVVGIPGHGEIGKFIVKIGSLKDIAKILTIENCSLEASTATNAGLDDQETETQNGLCN